MSAPNTRESRTPKVKSFRGLAERLWPPGCITHIAPLKPTARP